MGPVHALANPPRGLEATKEPPRTAAWSPSRKLATRSRQSRTLAPENPTGTGVDDAEAVGLHSRLDHPANGRVQRLNARDVGVGKHHDQEDVRLGQERVQLPFELIPELKGSRV
eukprot:6435264-Pyramimonas_sp.AAC.1